MRGSSDELQYHQIVVVHTEADAIPTFRLVTWRWNTIIAGVFDKNQTWRSYTLSFELDRTTNCKWKFRRTLNLSTQGHRRIQLLLINSLKREASVLNLTSWFTALEIMEVLKRTSSGSHQEFMDMPIWRLCPLNGRRHQRCTLSTSILVGIYTKKSNWNKLRVLMDWRRRFRLMQAGPLLGNQHSMSHFGPMKLFNSLWH